MNIIKLNEFMRFMNSDDSINLGNLEDSSSSTSCDKTANCNSIVLICVILSIILFVILCICGYLWWKKTKQLSKNKER